MDKKFATAINCMDGRVQEPVAAFIRKNYGVDYVDMITEPGPNKILASGSEHGAVDSLRQKVAISVTRHGSALIAVAGHWDCAGNPVDETTQKEQLRQALKTIRSWGFPAATIALWLDERFVPQRVDSEACDSAP